MSNFAENLKKARMAILITRPMTLRELEEKSGVANSSICLYEHGKNIPSVRNLMKLAAALDMTMEELMA